MLQLLLLFVTMSTQTTLGVGDQIPLFKLPDENGEVFSIEKFLGQNPLVIYFYPKDDTPGCTVEACTFRDNFEVFEELGAKVIGISSDTPQSHSKFKKRYNLPFVLLSDTDKSVQREFGIKKNFLGLIDGRVTFVADKHGVIKHVFSSQLRPKKHIDEAIRVIKRLK